MKTGKQALNKVAMMRVEKALIVHSSSSSNKFEVLQQ